MDETSRIENYPVTMNDAPTACRETCSAFLESNNGSNAVRSDSSWRGQPSAGLDAETHAQLLSLLQTTQMDRPVEEEQTSNVRQDHASTHLDSEISKSAPTAHPTSKYARPSQRPGQHVAVERKYRARVNEGYKGLREALPATSLTTDIEDLASPARSAPKSAIVDAANRYIIELWTEFKEQQERNADLEYRVRELQKLANCEDCPILQRLNSQTLHQSTGCCSNT